MRSTLWVLPIIVAVGCSGVETSSTTQDERSDRHGGGGGRFGAGDSFADVFLTHANVDLLQTSNTAWTLTKTGSLDTHAESVTWHITTTKGATAGGNLVVDGNLDLTNVGNGPASLGNIVVNLQVRAAEHHHGGGGGDDGDHDHRRQHDEWQTVASDVANATDDTNATSANVVASKNTEDRGTFTTGPGSGKLFFMDRATNTVFSLVPEVSLPKLSDTPLLFSASFDNNVLGLAQGSDVRLEVIVTFGNHAVGGHGSGTNIDINGNGVIDADEHRVRSVSNLFERFVPATLAGNASLMTTNAIADITTTGTVTFSNAVIDLASGTVTADYQPGASGGSITNCAHATGTGVADPVGSIIYTIVAPVDLTACDTETIHQVACTPGAPGCGWHDNDLLTFSQVAWGAAPNGVNISTTLENDFDTVFAPENDLMEIGIPGAGGFSIIFDDPDDLIGYLPAAGTPAPLTANLLDPASSASGTFGGEVAAMRLNVAFGDAGVIAGTTGLLLGDLHVCALTGTQAVLDGLTVRQIQDQANTLLGGGTGSVSITDMFLVINGIDMSFNGGPVSTFAQQSLVNGLCP